VTVPGRHHSLSVVGIVVVPCSLARLLVFACRAQRRGMKSEDAVGLIGQQPQLRRFVPVPGAVDLPVCGWWRAGVAVWCLQRDRALSGSAPE
jgi:hypothetical protein